MSEPIAILSAGMMTPVGLTAKQTARSIRAGISRVKDSPWIDRLPIRMGWLEDELLPPLREDLGLPQNATPLQRRLLRLATEPLQEALGSFGDLGAMPLFLGLPATEKGRPAFPEDFVTFLGKQAEVALDPTKSQTFPAGRAAFFLALQGALRSLEDPATHGFVLVGGLDSYFDPWILGHHVAAGRLMVDGAMEGFFPGEGAAFFLLAKAGTSDRKNLRPLAFLRGLGLGEEEGHLGSEKPYKGEGLSAAFAALFGASSHQPVRSVYTGFNGENLWAKEWGVGFLRHKAHFVEDFVIHHPAQNIGDTGAAHPAILLGCGALGQQQGHEPGPTLLFASSDGPSRGAALLTPTRIP